MSEPGRKIPVPEGVDVSKPSTGRLYDYYLRGQVWTDVDKEAAERVRAKVPEIHYMANANRLFLQRAAAVMARAGIDQFLDLGAGLPTQWNTHEVAQAINPGARVVYVDNDPTIVTHARYLLEERGETDVLYIEGDARDPDSILRDPRVTEFLDLSRPVGHMHIALWHFVSPDEDPYSMVRRYLDASVSGSYLALSHITHEAQDPVKVQALADVYSGATAQGHFRTFEEIDRFFDGLEYLPPVVGEEPGLSYVDKWGSKPGARFDPAHTWLPCGVARLP